MPQESVVSAVQKVCIAPVLLSYRFNIRVHKLLLVHYRLVNLLKVFIVSVSLSVSVQL